MAATMQQLYRRAAKNRVHVCDDRDCQCYRATAPDGYRFDEDLHEVIAVYGDSAIGNGGTKAEARDDLYDRLAELTLQKCQCEQCLGQTE